MIRLKLPILLLLAVQMPSLVLFGQSSKVAVVDFERAVVESAEGKQAQAKFNSTLEAKQKEVEKRQRELEDMQKKLQTQDKVLSDAVKADLQRDITRRQTELTRVNEDAQKELTAMRDELLRPIAERATGALNALAAEQGFTLIVDLSNPQTSILWFNPRNDITAELVRRIDASAPKPAAAPAAAPKPAAPPVPKPPAPQEQKKP